MLTSPASPLTPRMPTSASKSSMLQLSPGRRESFSSLPNIYHSSFTASRSHSSHTNAMMPVPPPELSYHPHTHHHGNEYSVLSRHHGDVAPFKAAQAQTRSVFPVPGFRVKAETVPPPAPSPLPPPPSPQSDSMQIFIPMEEDSEEDELALAQYHSFFLSSKEPFRLQQQKRALDSQSRWDQCRF